jgi:hypothetical protein
MNGNHSIAHNGQPNGVCAQLGYPLPADPPRNGNGHSHQPVRVVGAPEVAGSHLEACLRTAIDAAIGAQDYARSKGFSVQFLGGDIRAMAASLY